MSLQRYQESVRTDANGDEIGPIRGQIGWYVRKQTTGRPGPIIVNGQPLLIPPNAKIAELQQIMEGWFGCLRLYPVDVNGEVMEGEPIAIVHLAPDFSVRKPDNAQLMRIDRVFDMCTQLISVLEAKDMMLTRTNEALIDNQRDLQSGAAELLRSASSMTNVAAGIERPEMDLDMLSQQIAKVVEEKSRERGNGPWFVQLADTKLGQGFVDLVSGFASKLTDLQKNKKPNT